MWNSIESKLLPTLHGVWQLAVDRPVECILYLVPLLCLLVLLGRSLWRQEGRRAFWWATAIVLFNTLFSWGDDSYTHMYRIVALAEEFRQGRLGMLLTNPTTGQVLPVFVFYSSLPYLLPTLLNLLGMPVVVVFKLALGAQFLVLAFGLQALIDRTRTENARPANNAADFLIAILFIEANYVYTLWCTRAALAELWVYSFIPWVVLAILDPRGGRRLTGLLFVQACAHPIVLAQTLVCELVVPFGLSRLSLAQLARRCLGPLVLALVLASPFWLPQDLLKDFILGPAALPQPFTNSFRTLSELVHARDFRAVGPWMPIALVLGIAAARGRLGARFWVLAATFLLVLGVQWTGISALVARIPVLNLSVFVWRLMLPASFLAFGALLAGWRQVERPPVTALAPIAMLAVLGMLWVSVYVAPSYFVKLANAPSDRHALVNYDAGDGIWGIKEFLPNYARLPRKCVDASEAQDIKYSELRKAFTTERPYVVVRDGPTGFVRYNVPENTCEGDLVLGPVKPGDAVRVDELKIDALFYVRMLDLLAVAALGLWLARRARTQG
jgi:hypothetical protein